MTSKFIFILLALLGGNLNNGIEYSSPAAMLRRKGIQLNISSLIMTVKNKNLHTRLRIAAISHLRKTKGKSVRHILRSLIGKIRNSVVNAHLLHNLLELGSLTGEERRRFKDKKAARRDFFRGYQSFPAVLLLLHIRMNICCMGTGL